MKPEKVSPPVHLYSRKGLKTISWESKNAVASRVIVIRSLFFFVLTFEDFLVKIVLDAVFQSNEMN